MRYVYIIDPASNYSIYSSYYRKKYRPNDYSDYSHYMSPLRLLDITRAVLVIYRDTDHLYVYADGDIELVE